MVWILLSIIIILLDQGTKYSIIENIKLGESITVIKNFFYITHIGNKGAAFGLFQDAKVVFIPITLIFGGVITYLILKSNNKFYKLSLSLLLGGAVGNLIDRMLRTNGVVDFLDFRFGKFNFWIFNIADSCIVVGTILLTIYILFMYDKDKVTEAVGIKEDKHNNEDEENKDYKANEQGIEEHAE